MVCSIALDHLENNTDPNANQPVPGSKEELEAICTKVDVLYEGSEDDQEEAMRILQDNEMNVNVSWRKFDSWYNSFGSFTVDYSYLLVQSFSC